MLDIISGRELFNPGSAEMFQENSESPSLRSRVEDIVNKAGVIRQSHIDGRPNHSHVSTAEGASAAAQSFIAGKKAQFVRDDDKWFGQNAQEAWHNIKKLWNK